MTKTNQLRKRRVLQVADKVSEVLFQNDASLFDLWETADVSSEDTGGFCAEMGTIRGKSVRLEIWLDPFAHGKSDRLYAGFGAGRRNPIKALEDSAPKHWTPNRCISALDLTYQKYLRLVKPLRADEYNSPLSEHHAEGSSYYGFYDPSNPGESTSRDYFIRLAATFFLAVARSSCLTQGMNSSQYASVDLNNFPGVEPYRVRVHLGHERNTRLAKQRKIKDKFQCKVCFMRFEDIYGVERGRGFAEVHHLHPLKGRLHDVETKLDDLVTVCANCHRMLHRVPGMEGNIRELQWLIAENRDEV